MSKQSCRSSLSIVGGIFAAIFFLAGCGDSGSSGGTSGTSGSTAAVGSMDDLPDVSTLVSTSASGSLSALSAKDAVSGTAPLLKDINASNINTYFWDGLITTLTGTAVGAITQSQAESFWKGEGSCRMAQAVGHSFQNILQGGTRASVTCRMPPPRQVGWPL